MPLRVVWKNLLRHPLRSVLTAASLAVAIFLLATLHAVLATLDASVEDARDDRLITQSAVSLFVNLPVSYETKIRAVPGVETTCRWNWFGGYYQSERNFFGQFGTDPQTLIEVYPQIRIVEGSIEDFQSRRTGCVIGRGLAQKYGWKLGDRVPILSNIYRKNDGSAWEFDVTAIYEPGDTTIDNVTLFFHYDYVEEALRTGAASGPTGTSTFSIKLEPGADPVAVMSAVDALFENGPQRTDTVPQSVFNKQFVSMWGNVPQFVTSIGLAVFVAVLLACVNTMLMAARQQTHDVGIMKALGFSDGSMSGVLFLQSLALCGLGGGLGLLGASALPALFAGTNYETFFPGVGLHPETLALGLGATLLCGLLAGALPALRARRLSPVAALRTEET